MSLLDNTNEEEIEINVSKIIKETFEREDKEFTLMKYKYKNMFNAIIFNGETWVSDQNLYSGLHPFQEIDELVYIIGSNVIKYLQNKNVDTRDCREMFYTHKGFVEYDNYFFKVEEVDGQGSFTRITLIGDTDDIDKLDNCVKIEDLLNWMKNTDEWRMFQKKE